MQMLLACKFVPMQTKQPLLWEKENAIGFYNYYLKKNKQVKAGNLKKKDLRSFL